VPLPTEKNVYVVIRSPFKDKDSREHFEIRTHKRLIDIHQPTRRRSTRSSASTTCRPGVDIEIRCSCDGRILGRKLGMTQLFTRTASASRDRDRGRALLASPPSASRARRLRAVQLAFGETQGARCTSRSSGT
jgi:hypothetical protein